ncbi:AAC(3) family N-acetyltransferase [Campylobacter jejuni]|uniref:AAC(3) family N-acetyltransferase n=1 Tax=Campylobacter jejuni TaxID=197 RepID=UPI0009A718E8|nr:AAC(3) family N-acetyltransferase [Campylobacter jejuni]EHR4504751.1 AAC(3) family N-acetyltransferase [Campylobacter jejuni]EJU5190455.1 AAC(3) family N-acetyltransferase [Campylobacter jejuni]ELT3083669.1 AAC(3) family N-acetyltransferase [Campylobacter jejuni]
MKALLKSHESLIYPKDLNYTLEKLGLKQGDTLCIHSELFRLGEVLVSKQEFLQSIIDSFFQVIGNKGTLIMPTFSYSFNRYKNYDKIHTKSTMGILSEYFRTMAGGGVRTDDPIFSFFIKGYRQNDFTSKLLKTCFSSGCVYDKLVEFQGKIILFGTDKLGYTFSHFCEEKAKVNYRFFKEFQGIITDENSQSKKAKIQCYLRKENTKSDLDVEKQIAILKQDNNFNRIEFANSCIVCIDARKYLKANLKALKKDKFALVKD